VLRFDVVGSASNEAVIVSKDLGKLQSAKASIRDTREGTADCDRQFLYLGDSSALEGTSTSKLRKRPKRGEG
jgi:hypothetical protein